LVDAPSGRWPPGSRNFRAAVRATPRGSGPAPRAKTKRRPDQYSRKHSTSLALSLAGYHAHQTPRRAEGLDSSPAAPTRTLRPLRCSGPHCWVPLNHHVVLRSRHRALERDRSPVTVSWLIPAGRPPSGGERRHHEADSLGGPSRAESVAFRRRRPLVRRMKNSPVSLCHTSSLEQ
jgi:hypothetical protein